MSEVAILDVVRKEALKDAQRIYNEGGTVGLACENKRRSLIRLSADPSLAYYRNGYLCYSAYVETLTAEVERIFASHGMRIIYSVPKYGENAHLHTW